MIEFSNGGRLVEDVSELPRPGKIKRLYKDYETTSRDDKEDSLNPWYHCWVAGVAVTWDDEPGAWYIPVGHRDERWNLPRDAVVKWVRDVNALADDWENHNIKYDVHVETNDFGVDWVESGKPLRCSLVASKLKDSDRVYKGGYGLDVLSNHWLHEDISRFEDALKVYLDGRDDYGLVPADVMGEYACQDVITNRRLGRLLEATMPQESYGVWDTEIALTSILVEMERVGMRVDPLELRIKRFQSLQRMIDIEQELYELVGYLFIPTSNKDCHDVLCNHYGLPVVAWTKGNPDTGALPAPSFDKAALQLYLNRVDAPVEVVERIIEYRRLSNFKGLFLEPYEELAIDGVLHPTHNQCLRTARMSVSKPNSQQLHKLAKELIHPGEEQSFLSADASQIEFRTIAHYTQDPEVIAAYTEDPDVDYHSYVGEMCGMSRRPAKTLNFAVAFGQGRDSTVSLIEVDKDVVGQLSERVDNLIESGQLLEEGRDAMFRRLARHRGEAIYDSYHERFPNIKSTSRRASQACRHRGHIRNALGRLRRLPKEHSHKAFNTLNQSSAADIIKRQMVRLYQELRGTPIKLVTQVHDEIVLTGPTEAIEDSRTQNEIVAILEDFHDLRVPLRFKYGTSSKHWREASEEERGVPYHVVKQLQERGSYFEHLK